MIAMVIFFVKIQVYLSRDIVYLRKYFKLDTISLRATNRSFVDFEIIMYNPEKFLIPKPTNCNCKDYDKKEKKNSDPRTNIENPKPIKIILRLL